MFGIFLSRLKQELNTFTKLSQFRPAQCGNFRILLSLRFYVKSILGIVEVQKLLFLPFWGLWILLIWWIAAFKKCKNSKKSKFRAFKCVKMADFGLLESSKLISRKIWVIQKLWNFHNVIWTAEKFRQFLHWFHEILTF